ncbi:hypothetical protein ACGRL8_16135 [Vibrio rumoiensis]|uniref:Uncharacterized protein n=1 Tax=Vibrio rumoiensis TaxID=76258 RepID=A0ABW7IXV1_9VIBR
MAAEKLTKARLVQILIIFIILASAFTWRTYHHQPVKKSEDICHLDRSCSLNLEGITLSINFKKIDKEQVEISIQAIENKDKSKIMALSVSSNVLTENTHHIQNETFRLNVRAALNNSRWSIETQDGKQHWFTLKE